MNRTSMPMAIKNKKINKDKLKTVKPKTVVDSKKTTLFKNKLKSDSPTLKAIKKDLKITKKKVV